MKTTARTFFLIFLVMLLSAPVMKAQPDKGHAHRFDPPWHEPKLDGEQFIAYGINNAPDFHGDINNPDLVIFFAGNQYMVVPELLEAFRKQYPQYKRVFAETIPPGIEEKQIEKGALILGDLRISLKPDIITAGKGSIEEKAKKGWFTRTEMYAKNKLAIMVRKGNPKGIKTLNDLGKDDVKVSMPNPEWEGIGDRITQAYENAGGKDLRNTIMKDKKDKGTTYLTKIHHRETPMRLMYDQSDAGPVWYSEAYYHANLTDHPIDMVTIDDKVNVQATYVAGQMKDAPNPEAAKAFMDFLVSDKAQQLYKKYGFETVK
jgi:ABC-type molybdate transport system substrate-binding protein